MKSLKDKAAILGRVLLAVLFLLSGFSKLASPEGTIAYIESSGLPFPVLSYLAALGVELGLATLLIIGFQTRIVAVVMALFTVMAALAFHNNLADQGQFINFFKNISIAGGLLQIAAFGGGVLSVDAVLSNMKARVSGKASLKAA
ncbi:DoxX family protein [Pseudomonas sp. HN2-3]|jgi:putative oxidoreductase|uniref:DoxX family protein n=1 Tax=Pseudomonas sp. HN2-3 TaxID=2886360 RepID=UPI001D12A4A0|nr:DoxX family protein [Pseudomonas sp. HN2-3]UDU81193.1 DoxX family protein [Pseudomonas sp. HN2-3]